MNRIKEGIETTKNESIMNLIIHRLHKIYYELMKERKMQLPFAILMLIVMTLQLIAYAYYRKTEFPFEDEFHESIANFMDVIRVLPALENSKNTRLYVTVIICMVVFLALYIFQIIYIDYSITMNKFYFTFPIGLVRIMSSVLFWILITPITETMVSVFYCNNDYHSIMTSTECWTGIHFFYIVLCMIGLLLLSVISLLIALFYNETRLDSIDCLSRLDTNLEVYLFLYRFILAIISVYGITDAFQWILAFSHIIGSSFFIHHYFRYIPYYNIYTSIAYGSCVCVYLWVSFNLIITVFFKSLEYTGQSVIIILGIIIIIPLVKLLRERRLNALMFENKFDKIKNDFELDLYIKRLIDLMNNQEVNFLDKVLLLGFVNNHKSECKRPECPLSAGLSLYLPATDSYTILDGDNLNDPIMFRHLLAGIYFLYTENYNTTAALHINYSHYLLAYIGNIHMAMSELRAAEKLERTLQQSFTIFRNKRFIESFLKGKYKSKETGSSKQILENLDATLVITFESLFAELKKSIERSTKEHIEFWSHLDSLLTDTNVLHQIGLNIIDYTKETQEIWNKLVKTNANHPKALLSYGSYLSCIKNDDEEGAEYLDKVNMLMRCDALNRHETDFDIMFAENTAVIVISGSKENMGKILKTNIGVKNLFKYNKLEVIGHSIDMLMPQIIAAKHGIFLEKHFKSGKERMLNREVEMYAIPRSGSLIFISIIVKLLPHFKTDIQYISLIRKQSKDYNCILTNEQGRIDSVSAEIRRLFGLESNFLKKNEIYIQLLCPELLDITTTPNGEITTKLDLYQGVYDLDFVMPNNFAALIENLTMSPNMRRDKHSLLNDDNSYVINDAERLLEEEMSGDNTSPHRKRNMRLSHIVKKMQRLLYGRHYDNEEDLIATKAKINTSGYQKKWTWRVEIINKVYSDGALKIKVFKILKLKDQEELLKESLKKDCTLKRVANRVNPFNVTSRSDKDLNKYSPLTFIDPTSDLDKKEPIEEMKQSSQTVEGNKIQKNKDSGTLGSENKNQREETKKEASNADSSMISDINASWLDEKPLIIGGRKLNTKKIEAPTKESSNRREEYLKKGSAIVNIEEQHQIIKNYVDQIEVKEETKKEEKKIRKVEDDKGSIVSDTKNFLKHLKALRKSAYENYLPRSIVQLKYTIYFVFASILIITLVYFFLARSLYNNLSKNIENLQLANIRTYSFIRLAISVRSLLLMNEHNFDPRMALIDTIYGRNATDYYKDGYDDLGITSMDYIEWTFRNLNKFAISLKQAQNSLSTTTSFGNKYDHKINPASIQLTYNPESNIATEFTLDNWSTIMGLVTHSLRVRNMQLEEITFKDSSVYYILQNSFTNVLDKIYESTFTIMDYSYEIAKDNNMIILLLMIVASASILISAIMIIRVMVIVIKNKESILVLFTEIPSEHVKTELAKCKHYFNAFKTGDTIEIEASLHEVTNIEQTMVKKSEREDKKANDTDELLNEGQKVTKRQFKPFATKIVSLLLKFLFFVSLLEAYFLISYFRSSYFLSQAVESIKELGGIIERYTLNSLIYGAFQEYIGTNGKATVMGLESEVFVMKMIRNAIHNQEAFLNTHLLNERFHYKEYNDLYDRLVYEDVCGALFEGSKLEDCNKFYILNRGLQASNVAFWDALRNLANEFLELGETRDNNVIQSFFSNFLHINNERLKNRYFIQGYTKLEKTLVHELESRFATENNLTIIFFIIYLIIVIILFVIACTIFVESTRHSLWVTKSMLSIIPVTTIQEVKSIKDFLLQTSKALFIGS